MVRRGRGVEPVERFSDDAHRGVKANAVVRAHEVVVERLGHANDGGTALGEPVRDALGAVATNGDQGVEVFAQGVEDPFAATLGVVEVVAGRAEQGAALADDAGEFLGDELSTRIVTREPGPAVGDADEFVSVAKGHHAQPANRRVQARRVATSGKNTYTHQSLP